MALGPKMGHCWRQGKEGNEGAGWDRTFGFSIQHTIGIQQSMPSFLTLPCSCYLGESQVHRQ